MFLIINSIFLRAPGSFDTVLVSIPGGDLLETVSRNIGELANTLTRGLETVHLNSLKVQDMFLINKEENK